MPGVPTQVPDMVIRESGVVPPQQVYPPAGTGGTTVIVPQVLDVTTVNTTTVNAAGTVSAETLAITRPANGPIVAGRAALIVAGQATAFTNAALFDTSVIHGVALTSVANAQLATVQTQGPLSGVSLGAGLSCAVGCKADGTLCRVNDPLCVSGSLFVGYCDSTGAIYVLPETVHLVDVTDYGLVNDGVTDNSDALDSLIALFAALPVTRTQQQNALHFPAGFYKFSRTVGPFPFDMRVYGDALSDQEGRGGFNPDLAPFAGGTTFLCTGTGVGVALGHAQDSSQRNGTIFEGIEVIGQNAGTNASVATFNNAGTTVTVLAADNSYNRSAGSWIAEGFKVHDTIYFGNYTNEVFVTASFVNDANSGRHHVVAVTASKLTVAETLVNEAAVAGVNAFANQFNDVGIEVMGDVGVVVRDVRIGGFKTFLSFDGCESCLGFNVHFDGQQGATLGYPVAEQQANRGADSAFCYRAGSFYFLSGVNGNRNTLQQANFNACGWGFRTNGLGTDNVIRDAASENGTGFGYVETALGFTVEDCTCEGAVVATILIVDTVYAMNIVNVTGSIHVPLVDVSFTTYGLHLERNDCRNFTVPPVKHAINAIGVSLVGNNPPYSTSGSAIAGYMLDGDPTSAGVVEAPTDTDGGVGVNCNPNTTRGLDVNGTIGARPSAAACVNGLNSDVTAIRGGGLNGLTSFLRVAGPTGAYSIGGIVGGVDGAQLVIFSTVAQTLTIVNEDAASTPKNRLTTLTGGNIVNGAARQSTARLIYDGTTSRWIYLGSS